MVQSAAEQFSLQQAIRMISAVPASIWDLPDRGYIHEGMIADLNVFDPDTISPMLPTVEHDFPGGAVHIQQKSVGIEATVVSGEIVFRKGEPTGALPGRLIRGRLVCR